MHVQLCYMRSGRRQAAAAARAASRGGGSTRERCGARRHPRKRFNVQRKELRSENAAVLAAFRDSSKQGAKAFARSGQDRADVQQRANAPPIMKMKGCWS